MAWWLHMVFVEPNLRVYPCRLHGGQSRASKAILLVHEAWRSYLTTRATRPRFLLHPSPTTFVTESTPTQSDSGTNANADTVTDDSM